MVYDLSALDESPRGPQVLAANLTEYRDVPDPPERVLVVEDEPLIRRMLVRLLGSWGYDAVEAADGPDAVARFHEQKDRLDLVLLDIMLPHFDGVEVARAIRSEDAELPIVVCSAILNHGVRDRLRALNVRCCLDKPINAETLRSALDESLRDGPDA